MKLNDFTNDISGVEIAYNNNTNLKQCGAILPLSKEHIEEFIKCKNDIFYFATQYYSIMSLKDGIIKIPLRDYQYKILGEFIDKRFIILLASRQIGKSSMAEIFCLWYALFQKDKTIAVLANKDDQAKDMLRKIKLAFELLPKWLQQGIKIWNVKSVSFENGSRILAAATSSSSIRGKSCNVVICDEFAHLQPNIVDDFITATYPTISSSNDSKLIYISTFNGINHFYKIWNDAIHKRNEFTPLRVDWWEVPGRDEQWKEETLKNIGDYKFNQEYGNEALGSALTLIDGKTLQSLSYEPSIDIQAYTLPYAIPKKFIDKLKLYFLPIENHIYSIGLDSSEMQETSTSDSIILHIIDITAFPFQQVATVIIREGISYLEVPEFVVALCKFYNDAYLFIEANSTGLEIGNIIQSEYNYKNLYSEKNNPGFKTTKSTKKLGCSNLKMLLENQRLIIRDFDTISELSTFIKVKDTYKADKTYHDDCVMSLLASIFFMQDREFDGIQQADYINGIYLTKKKEEFEMIEMIYDDGFEEDIIEDVSWMFK